MLKYKCVVLDHDDTFVQSSIAIHYPAFVEVMKTLRPQQHYTFDEYRLICFNPGIRQYYRDSLLFNQSELDYSETLWRNMVEATVPLPYEGIVEVLKDYKELGGLITVNSHSHTSFIERDYQMWLGFQPDVIVGYNSDASWVKPQTAMIQYLQDHYQLTNHDILMVDDLTPGQNMAQAAGIDFAAAGYGISTEDIQIHFQNTATYYLDHASKLHELLIHGGE